MAEERQPNATRRDSYVRFAPRNVPVSILSGRLAPLSDRSNYTAAAATTSLTYA